MTLPVIFPSVVAASAPKAKAVTFDGTNDYLFTAGLSVSDGLDGTFSCWVKWADDSTERYLLSIYNSGTQELTIRRNSVNNGLRILGRGGATTRVDFASNSNLLVQASGWQHLIASWQAGATLQVYISDADQYAGSFTNSAGNITLSGNQVGTVEPVSPFNYKMRGDVAEFWFNNSFIDLSVTANRRKFIGANGKPAFLGYSGERPTGSAPVVYLKGPASAFATNNGSGGNFTVTGALTDASTSPSD